MIKSWLTFVIFLFQIENIDFISKVRYKNRIIYEVFTGLQKIVNFD